MQVTETLSQGLKREFKVVIPASDLAQRLDSQLAEMKEKVRINGFRPGKVPTAHLRRVYGRSVMAEVLQTAINEANRKIVEDNNLKLALEPKIDFPTDQAEVEAALAVSHLPTDKMTVFFNPMMLNTSGKLVLIDTGNGPNPSGAVGQLMSNMNAAGVEAKAVDMVVISHFHGDHINGLRLADSSLAFPNAEVKVPAAEWAFWMNDENMAKAPDAMKGAFANVRKAFDKMGDRLTQYEMDKDVAPGLTPFATHGHTPGHTSFALQSGKDRLIIQSDVTNNPALFLRNPGWHVMYDMNPQQAEATRRAFFDRAAADKTLIAGFHYPFPSLGYVEKDGANNFRLVPATWQTKI